MLKELSVQSAITFECPPDGGKVPIIDPYEGCTIECPYCFQRNDTNWNKDLYVKLNMPNLIKQQLKDWDRGNTIYIGSKCDPYISIERKYELTRQCLITLSELHINTMITTKAHHGIILRDLDILRNYQADLTVLLGLSNLNQLKGISHSDQIENIELANQLHRLGIKVWVYITPILPGITDVEKMIDNLDADIPVFLDKLRLDKDSVPANKMLEYIDTNYPSLKHVYDRIVFQNDCEYIKQLRDIYKDNKRVKFVFD